MTIDQWAERQAQLDFDQIKALIKTTSYNYDTDQAVLVDGSAVSPSWRALSGGAAVYRRADLNPGVTEMYDEALTEMLDDLPVYWEEGLLIYSKELESVMGL